MEKNEKYLKFDESFYISLAHVGAMLDWLSRNTSGKNQVAAEHAIEQLDNMNKYLLIDEEKNSHD